MPDPVIINITDLTLITDPTGFYAHVQDAGLNDRRILLADCVAGQAISPSAVTTNDLDVTASVGGQLAEITSTVANSNDGELWFQKARGGGTPSDVSTNDDIGSIRWAAYTNGGYQSLSDNTARIDCKITTTGASPLYDLRAAADRLLILSQTGGLRATFNSTALAMNNLSVSGVTTLTAEDLRILASDDLADAANSEVEMALFRHGVNGIGSTKRFRVTGKRNAESVNDWTNSAIRLEGNVGDNETAQAWIELRQGGSVQDNSVAIGEGVDTEFFEADSTGLTMASGLGIDASGGRVEAGVLNIGAREGVTISGGVATITSSNVTLTGESAATDDLDTITMAGVQDGDVLRLRTVSSSYTITAKDATGNLQLAGDFAMNNVRDCLFLVYDSSVSQWVEVSRSNNI